MRYRLLGPSGMRVSEMALGTMTFGEDWGWGASHEESRRIFDRFVEAGGNFIDTANNYTNGTSERYVGEFVADARSRFVVATKYTLTTRPDDPNGGGNSRKNMVQSVEESLKRLNTDYIDLLWLHMWDETTSVQEVMRGLDDLVRAGKVIYVGVSDTPAWQVSRANMLAELRGWSPFVAVQAPYSLASRDLERAILPMARELGLAVTPWGIIGGGVLTGKYNEESDAPRRYDGARDERKKLAAVVMEVAREVDRSPAQVAINWVRRQDSRAQIIPILGARTVQQIEDNLGALDWSLDDEQAARLEAASPFDPGFPTTFLHAENVQNLVFGENADRLERRR